MHLHVNPKISILSVNIELIIMNGCMSKHCINFWWKKFHLFINIIFFGENAFDMWHNIDICQFKSIENYAKRKIEIMSNIPVSIKNWNYSIHWKHVPIVEKYLHSFYYDLMFCVCFAAGKFHFCFMRLPFMKYRVIGGVTVLIGNTFSYMPFHFDDVLAIKFDL